MADKEETIQGLEDPQLLRHQRSEWVIERVGWCAMGLIVVAAMAGLLGPGPLTSWTKSNPNGALTVDYYGIERYESPACLKIRLDPRQTGAGDVKLAMSRDFADEVTPETIMPRPQSVEVVRNNIVYTFKLSDLGTEGLITYRFKYDDYGIFRYELTLNDQEPLQLRQYVLP